MKKLLKSAGDYGWLLALVAVVIVTVVWALLSFNPAEEGAGVILPDDPAIPPMLADHAERAPGEPRGETVGAAPSKTISRPNLFLEARGIQYNFYESPNWSPRGFNPVEAITVHVTGPGTCPGMRSWFSQPQSNASAHFGVCKDGAIEQYIELGDGAWHNGIVNRPDLSNPLITSWIGGGINPNSRTVGIELLLAPGENLSDYPKMRESFYILMWWLSDNLQIPLDRTHVIGHYQIDAINRSVDPRCCVSLDDVVADLSGGVVVTPGPVPTATATPTPQPTEFPFWDGQRWDMGNSTGYVPSDGSWERLGADGWVDEWGACLGWAGWRFNAIIQRYVWPGSQVFLHEPAFRAWSAVPAC